MPSQPAYTLTINTIQPYRDVIHSSALEYTSCETEVDVVHKLDKDAFPHLVQTIDGNMKQDSPQDRTQRNITCNWLSGRVHTVNPFPSDSTTQPALYQATNAAVYTATSLSKQRDVLISNTQGLKPLQFQREKTKQNKTHSPTSINQL